MDEPMWARRFAEKAIKENWPMSEQARRGALVTMVNILRSDSASQREKVRAAQAINAFERNLVSMIETAMRVETAPTPPVIQNLAFAPFSPQEKEANDNALRDVLEELQRLGINLGPEPGEVEKEGQPSP